MADLRDLMEYVHDTMPSVPMTVAERAISDAARTFCYYSSVWRETLRPVASRAGRSTYPLPLPDGTHLVAVHHATYEGRAIKPVMQDELAQFELADLSGSTPVVVGMKNSKELQLLPAPQSSTPDAIRVIVSLQPERGGMEIPDFIAERYGAEIAAGAKERLAAMPGTSFFNPDSVAMYRSEFRPAISRARRDAETSFNAADVRTVMRKWI